MTNLSPVGDHNICGSRASAAASRSRTVPVASRRSEGGYTLVALLAMMTVLALFAMAAAPSVQQQAQREREQEAIFRGEQVADAIREYYRYRTGSFRAAAEVEWRSFGRELRGLKGISPVFPCSLSVHAAARRAGWRR